MTDNQDVLLLFTELENYQPPELNTKLLQFNSYLTTPEIIEEMVSIEIFNQLPTYLQFSPKETLTIFKTMMINREVVNAFVSSTFVSEFLPFVSSLQNNSNNQMNEQNQKENIILSLRIINDIAKFSFLERNVVNTIISSIKPFIQLKYADTIDILFNFISHQCVIEKDLELEEFIGNFFDDEINEKIEKILGVYYHIMIDGKAFIKRFVSIRKCLERNEKTKMFFIGICSKIVALYNSFVNGFEIDNTRHLYYSFLSTYSNEIVNETNAKSIISEYIQKQQNEDQTKQKEMQECYKQIVSENFLNETTTFLKSTQNYHFIQFLLVFFETVSLSNDGIQAIKNSNILKYVLSAFDDNPIPERLYQYIFRIVLNMSHDWDIVNTLSDLHLTRYFIELIDRKSIEDEELLSLIYKVIYNYAKEKEFDVRYMQKLVDKKDFNNPYWIMMIIKFGKYIDGTANGIKNILDGFCFEKKITMMKEYLKSRYIKSIQSNEMKEEIINQEINEINDMDEYFLEDFCEEIDMFVCLYESLYKYYYYITSKTHSKSENHENETLICEEILFKYFTVIYQIISLTNDALKISHLLQNAMTLMTQHQFRFKSEWFTSFSIDAFMNGLRIEQPIQNPNPNIYNAKTYNKEYYEKINKEMKMNQIIQISQQIIPFIEEKTIIISQIIEYFESTTSNEILKKCINFFSETLNEETVDLFEGLEWIGNIIGKGISNNQLIKEMLGFIEKWLTMQRSIDEEMKVKLEEYLMGLMESEFSEKVCELITLLSN